jgi:hypothetical protein
VIGSGKIKLSPIVREIEVGVSMPPFALKENVYAAGLHTALRVVFPVGVYAPEITGVEPDTDHPCHVKPVFTMLPAPGNEMGVLPSW